MLKTHLSHQTLNQDHSNLTHLYENGFLPQRQNSHIFYKNPQKPSSRALLKNLTLSSENKRILKRTDHYQHRLLAQKDFVYDFSLQKKLKDWTKNMNWGIKTSSIKTIFTNHIFNFFYVWETAHQPLAYAAVLKTPAFSHIAYVFYNPKNPDLRNLPIRMVLQTCIDAHNSNQAYCYFGTFSKEKGYYKRNMPGFQYYKKGIWTPYAK